MLSPATRAQIRSLLPRAARTCPGLHAVAADAALSLFHLSLRRFSLPVLLPRCAEPYLGPVAEKPRDTVSNEARFALAVILEFGPNGIGSGFQLL